MSIRFKIAIVFILLTVSIPKHYGQSLGPMVIKGIILNSNNQQPLPYALVRVTNKSVGTVSNLDGEFSIGLHRSGEPDSISVSMMGYLSQSLAVTDLAHQESIVVYLVESSVLLEEVVVSLPDVEQIVKEVSKRLKTTFPTESIEFEGFHRKAYREFGKFVKLYEVAISGFDDNFHKRSSFVVSRLREKESRDFRKEKWRQSEGNIPWHYLWHVRRQHGYFFGPGNFKTYHYHLEDILEDKDDRIYKIRTDLKNSSERESTSYAFIRESDYAILEIRGETEIVNPKKFQLSDSLWMAYTGGTVSVRYMDHGGNMYPAYARSVYRHNVYDENLELQGTADMNEELFVHEIRTPSTYRNKNSFAKDQQKKINELPADSIFWKDFNAPLETALSRAIRRDLDVYEMASPLEVSEDWSAEMLIPSSSLEEDFALFRLALEEAHPSLYRFTPKKELDRLFESSKGELSQPKNGVEFFQLLTPIIAKIGCGHTESILPENYRDSDSNRNVFLPLQTKLIAGKLYVLKVYDPSKKTLEGREIASINGVSVGEIVDRIYPHLSGDGFVKTSKDRQLEENFVEYYGRLIEKSSEFEIITKNATGNSEKDCLSAISLETYSTWNNRQKPTNDFTLLSEQTGLLKTGTFMDMEAIGFTSWLQGVFQEIKEVNVNKLIIDLRGNEGGNDEYAINLLQYLAKEPFRFHLSLYSASDHYSFLSYTQQDESLNTLMPKIVKQDSTGKFRLQDTHPTFGLKNPYGDGFGGKVYFLIDGYTFSAAADFAALARELRLGDFIGEETGGTAAGNSSNGEILLTLPNSRIKVRIPLFHIQNAISQNQETGRGVIPDFKISYTIGDYLKNKDLELDFAIGLTSSGYTSQQEILKDQRLVKVLRPFTILFSEFVR